MRLETLEAKVQIMERRINLQVDTQLANQDTWVQQRLDVFELRMTRQLSSSQTLNIIEVKLEVADIKRIVVELHDRPIIPELEVMNFMLEVHVDNIQDISETVIETQEEKIEKKE